MGILGTIVVGLIVGVLARFLLPGEQKMGLILTILLGIGGSLLAGFVGQAMGWYAPGQGAGWVASVLGAIVLLVLVQKLRGSGGSSKQPRP
ncbi:MAG TPA: GlsB/YeaQ/YmgE family stress response membrane protein [Rubrivivax sp.]|nr:GlsB/YeaQ/YmgE family stress response membrane protein [Burkholderiales bacterium]HNT39025.1 GlsB/YeaQ/YmgE family stress response membrane protein [Rubrivivax sp.]